MIQSSLSGLYRDEVMSRYMLIKESAFVDDLHL